MKTFSILLALVAGLGLTGLASAGPWGNSTGYGMMGGSGYAMGPGMMGSGTWGGGGMRGYGPGNGYGYGMGPGLDRDRNYGFVRPDQNNFNGSYKRRRVLPPQGPESISGNSIGANPPIEQ
jgi:hypothetical protein